MTRLYAPLALACLLAVTLGCRSRITGNEGNFQFSYPADDDVVDFFSPHAAGQSAMFMVPLGKPARRHPPAPPA